MQYDTFVDIMDSLYALVARASDIQHWSLAGAAEFLKTDATASAVEASLSTTSFILCAILIAILGYVLVQKRRLTPGASTTGQTEQAPIAGPPGPLRAQWDMVRVHMDSPREADWKVAVLEADKLVDDALARAGFAGGTFGDRLTNIKPGDLVSLDGLWWAHRIRNRLAHESDYFLRYTEARQALSYFEAALNELHLI